MARHPRGRTAAILGLVVTALARPALADEPNTRCPDPEVAASGWRHRHRTPLVVGQGTPRHSLADPIVGPRQAVSLAGKFAYGTASIDLEDEEVVAFLRLTPCGPWREVGRGTTDRDGRRAIPLAAEALPGPGHYETRMVVRGDRSFADGTIWVLSPRQRVVVFDIDGTLTTGDEEMIREILLGATPAMREGANDAARSWLRAGVQPIYLTGRPYLLTETTRRWLASHDFPPGPVITTNSLEQAAVGRDHVGRFKREVLVDLKRRTRVEIVRAYGNADTDICAYAQAGIDPDRTFILGPLGGRACDAGRPTHALPDYPSHLRSIPGARPQSGKRLRPAPGCDGGRRHGARRRVRVGGPVRASRAERQCPRSARVHRGHRGDGPRWERRPARGRHPAAARPVTREPLRHRRARDGRAGRRPSLRRRRARRGTDRDEGRSWPRSRAGRRIRLLRGVCTTRRGTDDLVRRAAGPVHGTAASDAMIARLAALFAALAACSGGGDSPDADAGPDEAAEPMQTCAPGVWIAFCVDCFGCDPDWPGAYTPECTAPECQHCEVLVLRDDGLRLGLQIRLSDSTFSFIYPDICPWLLADTWSVDAEGTLLFDGQAVEATCTRSTLAGPGLRHSRERASAAVSRAVLGAWDRDECVGVPIEG